MQANKPNLLSPILLLLLVLPVCQLAVADKKCLYVSSYHHGYAWSDGVERGLRKVLTGSCEIQQIDMDTKRNKSPEFILQKAQSVKQRILDWQPDVVITSDDNAAKYVIQQFFKDSSIPFIFCGVNWTVKEYGFPYSNVTGIIEVAPLDAMLSNAIKYTDERKQAVYIGANTLTEQKNLNRMIKASEKLGIQLQGNLVSTAAEWKSSYLQAQQASFVVMGSSSGITNWDEKLLSEFAIQNAKKLTVTSHEWMMPFSSVGLTKIPEEHGEWAAQAAIEVLSGRTPEELPIVANRKWDLWINARHLDSTGITLPRQLLRKAKKVIH